MHLYTDEKPLTWECDKRCHTISHNLNLYKAHNHAQSVQLGPAWFQTRADHHKSLTSTSKSVRKVRKPASSSKTEFLRLTPLPNSNVIPFSKSLLILGFPM